MGRLNLIEISASGIRLETEVQYSSIRRKIYLMEMSALDARPVIVPTLPLFFRHEKIDRIRISAPDISPIRVSALLFLMRRSALTRTSASGVRPTIVSATLSIRHENFQHDQKIRFGYPSGFQIPRLFDGRHYHALGFGSFSGIKARRRDLQIARS